VILKNLAELSSENLQSRKRTPIFYLTKSRHASRKISNQGRNNNNRRSFRAFRAAQKRKKERQTSVERNAGHRGRAPSQRKLLEELADFAGGVSGVPLYSQVPDSVEIIHK
jgi:hypothetical protein